MLLVHSGSASLWASARRVLSQQIWEMGATNPSREGLDREAWRRSTPAVSGRAGWLQVGVAGRAGSPSSAQPPWGHAKAWTGCAVCGALGVAKSQHQGPECANSTKCQGWCYLLPRTRRSTAPSSGRGSTG